MLSHNASPSKFKKIDILPNTFFFYNGIELEINKRRKTRKFINMWKLNNAFLNNNGSQNKSKEKLENISRKTKLKTQHTETYGMK